MTKENPRRIKRLYQRIALAVQKKILSGEYVPGSRLAPERLLAEEYSVSRPTIREAMISLEISGLVEVRVGAGVFVVENPVFAINGFEHDIGPFELMEARRSIESEACAIAARNITDIQLAQLEGYLKGMQRENENKEIGEIADKGFHLTIAEGTQNSAFVSVIEHLWSIRETSPMLISMLKRSRGVGVQPIISDHTRIFTAIKDRDTNAARLAMHDHLTRVIDSLLEVTELEAIEQARSSSKALRSRYQSK